MSSEFKLKILGVARFFINVLGLQRFIPGLPNGIISVNDFVKLNGPGSITRIGETEEISENPPVIIGHHVSGRFTRLYTRKTLPQFVLTVTNGRVYGKECNFIITPDNKVIGEVSREFGREGGRIAKDFFVLNNIITAGPLLHKRGSAAVISTSGSDNFHHWNYDILPRFFFLKKAGLLDKADRYLLNYQGWPYQKEGLARLGIDESKICNTCNEHNQYWQFDTLYVPSLPQALGTISPLVVNFLRSVFMQPVTGVTEIKKGRRIYLSRRKALTRKIINAEEVMSVFNEYGFEEVIPEDYNISQMAMIISGAASVASIHGSGLSNLVFLEKGAKVLDILAPYHQDGYYWQICNQRESAYVGLFAEGPHPPDTLDLSAHKKDGDLLIDIVKLRQAIKAIL